MISRWAFGVASNWCEQAKVEAVSIEDVPGLVFTKVMDELELGLVDEDEESGLVANNFAAFNPKKQGVNVEVRLLEDERLTAELEEAGLDVAYILLALGSIC